MQVFHHKDKNEDPPHHHHHHRGVSMNERICANQLQEIGTTFVTQSKKS